MNRVVLVVLSCLSLVMGGGCARIEYGSHEDATADDPGVYDFTGGKLPSTMTFSRTSDATLIGTDGNIATFSRDTPRFTADGLLMEGKGSNLIGNTRFEAGGVGWELDNTDAAHSGVQSGGLLGNGGFHFALRRVASGEAQGVFQHVANLRDELHTVSFVARRVGNCTLRVFIDGVDLGDPIALTDTPARYSIGFVPNDDTLAIGFYCATGAEGDGWDLSHVQVEAEPYASSVIVNDSLTVPAQRSAESLVTTIASSAASTVVFSGRVEAIGDRSCLACLVRSHVDDPILALTAEPNPPRVDFGATVAGFMIDGDGEADLLAHTRVAASFDGAFVSFARDGAVQKEDVTLADPTYDRLLVGPSGSDFAFDGRFYIERIVYRPEAADLAELTAP